MKRLHVNLMELVALGNFKILPGNDSTECERESLAHKSICNSPHSISLSSQCSARVWGDSYIIGERGIKHFSILTHCSKPGGN